MYTIKTNKCTCIKYVLSCIINYRHVLIAFAIIIRLSLEEYKELKQNANLYKWD